MPLMLDTSCYYCTKKEKDIPNCQRDCTTYKNFKREKLLTDYETESMKRRRKMRE